MLKRQWGAESNAKLQYLFIPSKTATLVSKLAVEDLPLGRPAALAPEFPVKDLPLTEHSDDDDDDDYDDMRKVFLHDKESFKI